MLNNSLKMTQLVAELKLRSRSDGMVSIASSTLLNPVHYT